MEIFKELNLKFLTDIRGSSQERRRENNVKDNITFPNELFHHLSRIDGVPEHSAERLL